MKVQNKTRKSSFFKKLFIKFCRFFDYEIVDQGDFSFPTTNKKGSKNLSNLGIQSLVLPMGRIKIKRPIRSLDIILRTCASVNMLTQSKKRIFKSNKKDYSLKTLKSLINSINNNKKIFKNIKVKLTIIDHNSNPKVIEKFKKLLKKEFFKSEILNLNINFYKKNIKKINQQGNKVTDNQISNMSNINQSLNIGKNCDDLVYFVEDDYLHKRDAIEEMILSYERISSQIGKELIMCPADYPYLYKKLDNSSILTGENYHWRSVKESLLTFMTSKNMIDKHFETLQNMAKIESDPFEKNLHKLYEDELCLSPLPSLSIHCTNVNSIFGISPNVEVKKIWDDNKV